MGMFDWLFGPETPKTMTGNDVDPAKSYWWGSPTNIGNNGPMPEDNRTTDSDGNHQANPGGFDGWLPF